MNPFHGCILYRARRNVRYHCMEIHPKTKEAYMATRLKGKAEFFHCEICGNLTYRIDEGPGTMTCCGKDMVLLKANSTDGAREKHVPVVAVEGPVMTVRVGEIAHPMEDGHHIAWIFVAGNDVDTLVKLAVDGSPEAMVTANLADVVSVYAYCNLHGLFEVNV